MPMEERRPETPGDLVKARTLSLQRAPAALARRGLQEIARFEIDPEVLRLVRILKSSGSWDECHDAHTRLCELGPGVKGWEASLRELTAVGGHCLPDEVRSYWDDWCKILAAMALSAHGCASECTVPVLVDLLWESMQAGDTCWLPPACAAIARYGNLSPQLVEQATPALLSALYLGSSDEVPDAEKALRRFGMDPLLSAIITYDGDEVVQSEAIRVIGSFGAEAEKAIPQLLLLAQDHAERVRMLVGFVLGDIGIRNDRVTSVLRVLREDEEDSVRVGAAYASLKLEVPEHQASLSILIDSLQSLDFVVRRDAAWVLEEVGPANAQLCLSALRRAAALEQYGSVRVVMERAIDNLSRANS